MALHSSNEDGRHGRHGSMGRKELELEKMRPEVDKIQVFSASNVAPLLLSYSRALLMMASILFRLPCAVGPVTNAVKS
jgi:hypothetical protein